MARPIICGVYLIQCEATKKAYIGSSVRIYQRWSEHKKSLNKGISVCRVLQNAWTRYGAENFTFHILEECSRDNLLAREHEWITKLDPELNTSSAARACDCPKIRARMNAGVRRRAALITHCKHGHEYTPENTMLNQGKRICKKCNAERVNKIYKSMSAEEREKALQYKRDYHFKNRESRLARMRQYVAEHKDEKRAYDQARRCRNQTS